MRRACIDIGANTTRLLVADCVGGDLTEVHQERVFTRIGQAIDADGQIPAAKLREVAETVAAQMRSARALGAADIRCVATAGVRRATNGEQLLALISELAEGATVEILSGQREAQLAFIGAAWACGQHHGDGALGVVDVGGGSCEMAVGNPPAEVTWWCSLAIGSSDLIDDNLVSDPPLAEEYARAGERVREMFAGTQPPPVARVVAVGGSAASLTRITGPRIDRDALALAMTLLTQLPAATIAAQYGLEPERVRLLAGGLLILDCVVDLFGTGLTVGGAGLREGLLLGA
jgi:exopolyphosphatase/guanosine-5'-triphosphate,3'-diphosphate pyrophosphatase